VSIRFIHQYFFPDHSSVSQVISQIAFYLAGNGEAVSVICSQNRYDGAQGSSLPSTDRTRGVDIYRCWGPSFGRGSLAGRILDMASFYLLSGIRLLISPPAETNVFLTNPPFFSVVGALFRKIRGGRFVYILMDVYPDIMVRAGMLKEGGCFTRILRWISRFTVSSADTVIVLGEDMRQVAICSGAPSEKVVIIRNWADPIKICPIAHEENRFRREWGLYGKFVVEYSGNLGVSHSFEDLLAVAESVADNDDIRFLFIGGGIRFRELERAVASRGLGNVIMMPYQKSSDLAHSLSAGDVHYVSLRTGFEGLVVPSKAYGIMAAGRPMIYQGDEKGDIAQMIKRERCGIVIPEGDRERLKEGILRFYRDRAMVARMGMFARRALEEKYSASIGLANYQRILAAGN